jgi:hypothetical protein
MDQKDLRYNRVTRRRVRKYLKDFTEIRRQGTHVYDGLIKCKLVHGSDYSLVIPDQVYIAVDNELHWIQPIYFSACSISRNDQGNECTLAIDISHGLILIINFASKNLEQHYKDGSLLYSCTIRAPKFLHRYTTGKAKHNDGQIFLKVHHHTTPENKISIQGGKEFWSSPWNIQGTKKFENIAYLYMTALPSIDQESDLTEIAMSSTAKLDFRRDSNTSGIPDLTLTVYRESVKNRKETLSYWIDASALNTQPIHKHTGAIPVYYEYVGPYIQRIGVETGSTIKIIRNRLVPVALKYMDYVVVGDANTNAGLEAPYDEEQTKSRLMIERLDDDSDINEFWFSNSNTNQFDNKTAELAAFKIDDG